MAPEVKSPLKFNGALNVHSVEGSGSIRLRHTSRGVHPAATLVGRNKKNAARLTGPAARVVKTRLLLPAIPASAATTTAATAATIAAPATTTESSTATTAAAARTA